ncbi:hypothetical protein [Halalkalibacter urbisdiaboli]|uniref:hypothetical protein n=1 Tax=Halalkalibacter urbisdiaboli TaxID=1960589 RepID=UPI001FD8FFCA|nr:hypothetical protein [Halalkalibacter urbisdiaboli]
MLRAIADGEEDPEKLAGFARRTMKRKKNELKLALKWLRSISPTHDGKNDSATHRFLNRAD